MPTGIVAQSQSERSQMQNRKQALALLEARVQARRDDEAAAAERALRGPLARAEFGAAALVRSYVLHPQARIVCALSGRTGSDARSVIDDGELDVWLRAAALADNEKNI